MKKVFILIFVLVMALNLAACGGKKEETGSNNSDSANSTQSASVNTGDTNTTQPASENTGDTNNTQSADNSLAGINDPVHDYYRAAYSSATGAYATITVKAELGLKEDAWVGLCPKGKEYKTELEADEVDVIWFGPDYHEEGDEEFVFACDFSDVDDGTYALVVATSDNEEDAKIVIQVEMTKTGDSISFDYSDAKLNK